MISDRIIVTLVVTGLLVQTAAVGIGGFTSLGWRWPMVGAGTLVALGCLLVVFLDKGKKLHGLPLAVVAFSVLVLGLALAHSFSNHPALTWSLQAAVTVQALGMLLLMAVFLTFKMGRLF